MGVIGGIGTAASVLLGGRNVIVETAGAFRENAEAAGKRQGELDTATLAQYAAEFAKPHHSWFDCLVDGMNRLPRPALALGTLGLFVSAMVAPIWFAMRMQALALVPEPLWWLMGAIVTFYFGARHQAKGQDFQRSIAETVAAAPAVMAGIERLGRLAPAATAPGPAIAASPGPRDGRANWALDDWRSGA